MTFSFRINREHDAFTASAICIGDVVPVRACGRLSTCTKTPQNEDRTPVLFPSVSFLPLPSARQLVARSRRILPLLSRPFSSVVVIGNTLRRLASVLLLRLSQPPRLSQGLKNFCGLPNTRRSVFLRAQAAKQSARDVSCQFEGVSSVVAPAFHEQKASKGTIHGRGKISQGHG